MTEDTRFRRFVTMSPHGMDVDATQARGAPLLDGGDDADMARKYPEAYARLAEARRKRGELKATVPAPKRRVSVRVLPVRPADPAPEMEATPDVALAYSQDHI